MATPTTGSCLCGAVRFTLEEPPVALRACWCRDCQYLASGNASINAIVRTASLAITGALGAFVSPADSGQRYAAASARNAGRPSSATL